MWPWRACEAASASSEAIRSSSVSPMPDEDPGRERDTKLAGCVDRLHADRRVLCRRAGVDGLHQALGDRFEHEALRRRHLAKARQVVARERAEVRVRQEPALERPLACPGDVGDEVVVTIGAKALRDLGVHLGPLTGQDEKLLRVPSAAPRRASSRPHRARTGAPCGSRTSSTCTRTCTCAKATACSYAKM